VSRFQNSLALVQMGAAEQTLYGHADQSVTNRARIIQSMHNDRNWHDHNQFLE